MMLLFSGTPKNKTRTLLGGVKDVLAILSFPASFNSSWILDALFILGYNLGVMSRKPPPKNEGWVGLTENANKSDGQPHRRGGGGYLTDFQRGTHWEMASGTRRGSLQHGGIGTTQLPSEDGRLP